MCGSAAPEAPNTKKLIRQAKRTNKEMANFQASLNNVNQETPFGTLTYSQTKDADGNPVWTATQDYNKQTQKLFDKSMQNQKQTMNAANDALRSFRRQDPLDFGGTFDAQTITERNDPALGSYGGYAEFQAPEYDTDTIESRLLELGSKRLDPLLAKRREQQNQSLADRGIAAGSGAYGDAQRSINEGENDAYNQLILTGRGQAMNEMGQQFDQSLGAHQQNYGQDFNKYNTNFNNAMNKYGQDFNQQMALRGQQVNEAMTLRANPLNEFLALSGGAGQVQTPTFTNPGQTGVGGVDTAGINQNAYNQQYGAWQDQKNSSNQMWGGLLGAGANLLMMSDDRTKKDKERVGETNGMGIYEYRYKDEPETAPKRMGLMASEVEKVVPDAVHEGADGFRRVDYARALGAAKR